MSRTPLLAGPLAGGAAPRCRPLLALAVLWSVASPALAGGGEELSFERLNRTYSAFLTELSPIEIGPAKVLLASPDHSLTVLVHRVVLTPAAGGVHDADLELRFSGRGKIEADITFGTVHSRLEDELGVPVQTLRLRGQVRIVRDKGGYLIETVQLPPSVTVRIESLLASRLFAICRPMTLVLVNIDCDVLERALTFIEVPLPPIGEVYLLPDEELTEDERRRFDSYLERRHP